jgi:hypothetical protein
MVIVEEPHLQLLDVATKCWLNKQHGHHPTHRNIKMRGLLWRNPHQLNTFDITDLLQLAELFFIELEMGLILFIDTNIDNCCILGIML